MADEDQPTGAVRHAGHLLPVFTTTLRSILFTKKTPLLLGVLLVPVVVTLVLSPTLDDGEYVSFEGETAAREDGGRYWFEDSTMILYLGLLVPLVAAFFATGLIGDEVAAKTLPYLFVRPVYRWAVLLAKFAAFAVATFALTAAAIATQFFVALSIVQNPFSDLGELFVVLGVLGLAVLANGAFFTLIGVSVRYPLVFAITYFVLWENIFGSFPAQIKRFTFVFYERTLVTEYAGRTNFLDEFLGLEVNPLPAVLILIGSAVVFLAAACVVVSVKDYNV